MIEQFDEAYRLFSKLVLGDHVRQGTSTSIKNGMANIYSTDDKTQFLRYSRLSGILTLDVDRKLKSSVFRMYSMDSLELLFECELYYGFEDNYRQITQTMWAFDILEGIIAFEFDSSVMAEGFASAIKKHSRKMSEYVGLVEQRRKEDEGKKKEGSFLGKIKNMFQKEQKRETSRIISVKKENSITFDQNTGRFDNIPPQLETAFVQLGFTKKELENKQTAKVLFQQILMYQTLKEAADDPNATLLRQTVRNLGIDIQPQVEDQLQTQMQIPPPPEDFQPTLPRHLAELPLNILTATKSSQTAGTRDQSLRSDLLKQIQAGSFKLKPVSQEGNKLTVDLSSMDKDQRQDMSDYLRAALRRRNKALMRDQARDQEDDDE